MTKFHSKQSALARRKIASFAVLLVLSTAMAGPPASTGNSAPTPATQVPAHLAWPDSGIAQRRFTAGANGTMFVEDDHGKLHAWVLSNYTKLIDHDHADATALDFFSGKVIKVKVDLTEDGHPDEAFTDSDGEYHSFYIPTRDAPRYRFSSAGKLGSLPGLNFNGDSLHVPSTILNGCDVLLTATASEKNQLTHQKPAVVWQKFPIYHAGPFPEDCSSGDVTSAIDAALDLDDGTFLAAEGCFVFRLRKADLSPVGSAPALRVVDESTVNAVLAKLHGKTIDDPTGYLIKALNLPTGPNVSCQED